MRMSSRFFNKKNKIRKIKIIEYIQCYGFKKIKEKYKNGDNYREWKQPATTCNNLQQHSKFLKKGMATTCNNLQNFKKYKKYKKN